MELRKPEELSTQSANKTAQPKGGSIAANVNQAGVDLAKSSFSDGVNAAVVSNDAFALGYVKTRKKGTEQMLKTVKAATDSTAAAIAAIDLSEIEEGYGEIDPFSGGLNSLLG